MKNVKTRYYLESKSKDVTQRTKPELIMAEISYGYSVITPKGVKRHKPARFSLQESILPSKFGKPEDNFKFHSEIFARANKNNSTIKNRMLKFEGALNEITNDHIINKTLPTPKELNLHLSEKLRTEKVEMPKIDVLTYIYAKIANEKADSDKSKKNSKRLNTIKIYTTVSHLIENYQLAKNEKLLFETLDKVKYWEIWDVLDDILKGEIKVDNPNQTKTQRTQPYGYLVTTIRKYQKALITTLKEAVNEGIQMPLNVLESKLILEDKDATKNFYLEIKELKKIVTSNVSFDAKLQIAKDYIIVACFTGMRFESMFDAQNAKIEHHKEKLYNFKYIHSKQNKTSTEVFIPLLKPVLEVFEKYGRFPIVPENSIINIYLKELFKHLKINRMVDVVKVTYRNGTITTNEPISDLISTHDCKGTFYSNLYDLYVPESIIDNITHPDRMPKNAMAKVYNKTTMLSKAKMFVDAIKNIDSDLYKF